VELIEGSRARKVIEALCSGPKLQIIKLLLENRDGLRATELSKVLGIKLSTVLKHLEDLVSSGLVNVSLEGTNRVVKRYLIRNDEVLVKINLRELVGIESCVEGEELVSSEVRELAMEYVRIKRGRRRGKLPLRPKVRDVANVLGLSIDKAIEVVNYINTHQHEVTKLICEEVEKLLKSEGPLRIKDLADKLKVHPYWVVTCVEGLRSLGKVVINDSLVSIREG